jgi:protein TonB
VEATPGPLERRAELASADRPIPLRTLAFAPHYPPDAAAVGLRAAIRLRLVVDELGRVAEVRLADTPILGMLDPAPPRTDESSVVDAAVQALATVAADSVRQWLYEPPPTGSLVAFDVTFRFTPDSDTRIDSSVPASAVRSIAADSVAPPSPPATSAPPPGPAPFWAEGVTRVGGDVASPTKVTHVSPVYPPSARAAGVQGIVVIDARIEPDGRVIYARVLESVPLLDQAALDAVLMWAFSPPLVRGAPAPVLMRVTMQFSLP